MSGRCPPASAAAAAASLLTGLVGSALLCRLSRAMSSRGGGPAACLSGASGGSGSRGGGGPTTPSSPPPPPVSRPWLLRLPGVPGAEPSRANDLLLLLPRSREEEEEEEEGEPPPPPPPPPHQHHVLYFPGDVQSYREIMICHPENFQWERWCLEHVAAILGRRFPGSYIWVIKCSRMHLHKFSCYDNFVASNLFGAPEHSGDFGAFRHLHALLVNAFKLAQNVLLSQKRKYESPKDTRACELPTVAATNGCPESEMERDWEHFNKTSVSFIEPSVVGGASFTLIGFSKGCVVLNQLLYELKEAKKDKNINAFIKNIRAIYWLDGGHSGGSNTWVTYPDVLKDFAETGISVNAHVTPYQVFDPMRAWIGREHRRFVQILEELGVNVHSQLHFGGEAPSLDNHFRVHDVF